MLSQVKVHQFKSLLNAALSLSVYPKNEPSAKKLFCNYRGLLLLFSNAIINEMEKSSNDL